MLTRSRQLALITGDERVVDWRQVFEREFPRIYNYFRYRLGDEALAEDLAAETFARAWRSRRQYDRDLAAFSTWLLAIARNLVTDHLRRRRPQLGLEAAQNVIAAGRVDEEVQHRQDLIRLAKLLEALSDREREIIALRYGAGLSYREIGRELDLRAVNVRVIVYRTVRKLRAQWREDQ